MSDYLEQYIQNLQTPQAIDEFSAMLRNNSDYDRYEHIAQPLMRAHMLTLLSPPVPNSGREEAIETMNSQLGFILREENTEELMADYINKIESADQLQILEEELTNGAYDFEAAKETEEEPSPSWAEAMAPLIEQRRTEIVGTQL